MQYDERGIGPTGSGAPTCGADGSRVSEAALAVDVHPAEPGGFHWLELWTYASASNGPPTWIVRDPSGAEIVRIASQRYASCAGPQGMFAAAVASGQLAAPSGSNSAPITSEPSTSTTSPSTSTTSPSTSTTSPSTSTTSPSSSESSTSTTSPNTNGPSTSTTSPKISESSTSKTSPNTNAPMPSAPGGASLANACARGTVSLVYGAFGLSANHRPGRYHIDVRTSDGLTAPNIGSFDVRPRFAVERDFTSVDFGELQPGARSVLASPRTDGQASLTSPSSPFVTNRGNEPITLDIRFAPLCPRDRTVACTPPRRIDNFEVTLGVGAFERTTQRTTSDVLLTFGTARAQTLCPGESARLDISAIAPEAAEPGSYAGSMSVAAIANRSVLCSETPTNATPSAVGYWG